MEAPRHIHACHLIALLPACGSGLRRTCAVTRALELASDRAWCYSLRSFPAFLGTSLHQTVRARLASAGQSYRLDSAGSCISDEVFLCPKIYPLKPKPETYSIRQVRTYLSRQPASERLAALAGDSQASGPISLRKRNAVGRPASGSHQDSLAQVEVLCVPPGIAACRAKDVLFSETFALKGGEYLAREVFLGPGLGCRLQAAGCRV